MALSVPRSGRQIAEINVTPMADVMIVLLIIFMVTVPVLTRGVARLPEAANTKAERQGPVVVSIASSGAVYVNELPLLGPDDLRERLRAELESRRERLVHVKADARLSYADVAKVIEACRASGADEVAFIATERPRG
jgi:biopolymer transport protein ExbD